MPYILTSTANPSSPQSWVKMETESILSGHSEYGNRVMQNGHRTTPRPLPPLKGNITILLMPREQCSIHTSMLTVVQFYSVVGEFQ